MHLFVCREGLLDLGALSQQSNLTFLGQFLFEFVSVDLFQPVHNQKVKLQPAYVILSVGPQNIDLVRVLFTCVWFPELCHRQLQIVGPKIVEQYPMSSIGVSVDSIMDSCRSILGDYAQGIEFSYS